MTKRVNWGYYWTHDKALICARLAERRAALTICLKTKDDACFLERWITHHAQIVGLRNLVIFDNMSTSDDVWRIYGKYAGELLVVQFEGHCDALHHPEVYRELYGALKQSTAFCAFLDTDEFLIRMVGAGFHADASIVDFIQSCGEVNWLPGTWLHNAFRSDSVFQCGSDMSVLIGGLTRGKPIVRPSAIVGGCVLHNWQLYSNITASRTHTNLFLLHRKNLSVERRIAVLMCKIARQSKLHHSARVRTFVSDDDDLQAILAKETDYLTPNLKQQVSELRSVVKFREKNDSTVDKLEAGHVRFCADGKIEYFSDTEKKLFRQFLEEPDAMTRRAFRPDH